MKRVGAFPPLARFLSHGNMYFGLQRAGRQVLPWTRMQPSPDTLLAPGSCTDWGSKTGEELPVVDKLPSPRATAAKGRLD